MTPTEIEIIRRLSERDVELAVEFALSELAAIAEEIRSLKVLLLGNVIGSAGAAVVMKILALPLLAKAAAVTILAVTIVIVLVLIRKAVIKRELILRTLLQALEDSSRNRNQYNDCDCSYHMRELFWACLVTAIAWIIVTLLIVLG